MRQVIIELGVRHSYCAVVPGRVTRVHRRGRWRNQGFDANAGRLVPVFGSFGRAIDEEKAFRKAFERWFAKSFDLPLSAASLQVAAMMGGCQSANVTFQKGCLVPTKHQRRLFV